MFCFFYIRFVCRTEQQVKKIIGSKMADYLKEVDEKEMGNFDRAYIGFLIGTGIILSMWFFSGLYYLIIK